MQLTLQELLKFIEQFINAVIARRAKPDVAIPSEKSEKPNGSQAQSFGDCETSLWAGFAMTFSFGSINSNLMLCTTKELRISSAPFLFSLLAGIFIG